jgi:hypothetical protein
MDRLDAVVKTLAEHPLVVVLPTRNSDGAHFDMP